MRATRHLIVNADDFGSSRGVNRGIIKAHDQGIVTSASLMVRWPAAAQAAAWAREHPDLSLGLHVDLGEWAYRKGRWEACYQVTPTENANAVLAEVRRQLDSFRDLVNEDPAHLDSHQHVHRDEPVRSILLELASELGVPLRDYSPHIHYEGGFYGQTGRGEPLPAIISEDGLCRMIRTLPKGITEMGCHPGLDDDLETTYRSERAEEVRALCSLRVRDLLSAQGISLVSFRDVAALRVQPG